ncbi:MAG TPA: class I fructose-bisphosphate aldolase [Candidatus Limnocylindria bacterium]|jgi:fructose-bisphosphate aldolase class I|nr:class I fructose-bisphosphate aldolase [Candidatus Limnocylindria bacterium]
MEIAALEKTARQLVAPGKGILAADESTGTLNKRFDEAGIPATPENRRAYREMLFSAPGLGEFISGVILFDETIRQKDRAGTLFVDVLQRQGILPGIKVDTGAHSLAGFPGEKVTEGLDGLRDRLSSYSAMGARFAKWRAVIEIGPDRPSHTCLAANAHALARYAALCQESGIVPIVEPEVLMTGAHSFQRHFEVTRSILILVFQQLFEHRVHLGGMLLKPNMVLPGEASRESASVEEVAAYTRRCLNECVPSAVPGIVFLSGGQSETDTTKHLNALNGQGATPWTLSFSFGRALQEQALKTWRGKEENTASAQAILRHRASCNAAALTGSYTTAMEGPSR